MKWLARAVDATERVLVSLGISVPGMPAGDEKKAVIEDFLRLQGYDHPRPELDSWQWLCERAGASPAVREGKDQVVNGTERLRGLVLDAALSAMSMWIDEKLAEVSIVLQNEANQAAIKVSAPAMCQEKASVTTLTCWSASSSYSRGAPPYRRRCRRGRSARRGGGLLLAERLKPQLKLEKRQGTRRGGSSARSTLR